MGTMPSDWWFDQAVVLIDQCYKGVRFGAHFYSMTIPFAVVSYISILYTNPMQMTTSAFSDAQEGIMSLAQANDMFQSRKGPGIVDEPLRDFILNHGLADKFGVILVHCHAHLKPGEAMVSYNNTSSPWPSQACVPCGGSMIPQAWRMKDGKLQPYEYRFVPSEAGLQDALSGHSSFVTEFMEMLERHGLSGCAGLSLVPEGGKECLEITVNSANIMIPYNEVMQCPDTSHSVY